MSRTASRKALFQEIALRHFRGKEVTIDEMCEVFLAEGVFTAAELRRLARPGLKAWIRKHAREPQIGEDGTRYEQVNFKRDKAVPGKQQQVFAYLDEIVETDFRSVIKDRIERRRYFTNEVVRLLHVYGERFGTRAKDLFQARLNLDFEVGP